LFSPNQPVLHDSTAESAGISPGLRHNGGFGRIQLQVLQSARLNPANKLEHLQFLQFKYRSPNCEGKVGVAPKEISSLPCAADNGILGRLETGADRYCQIPLYRYRLSAVSVSASKMVF
jgi:hypothetical protein